MPSSGTGAATEAAINACSAAADELGASRRLIDLLESENTLLKRQVSTGRQTAELLTELNAARTAETNALRAVIEAQNETIAAKDNALASQARLADALQKKKTSPLKRLGDILIGAAAIAILK